MPSRLPIIAVETQVQSANCPKITAAAVKVHSANCPKITAAAAAAVRAQIVQSCISQIHQLLRVNSYKQSDAVRCSSIAARFTQQEHHEHQARAHQVPYRRLCQTLSQRQLSNGQFYAACGDYALKKGDAVRRVHEDGQGSKHLRRKTAELSDAEGGLALFGSPCHH